MSNTKHTPGPWAIRTFEEGPGEIAIIHGGPHDEDICELKGYNYQGEIAEAIDHYEANMKLIAAAPDMLEALQSVIREMNLDGTACAAKVHAAINKATE